MQHQAALPLHDQFSAAHWNRQGDDSSAHAFCCLKASANTTLSGLMARSSTYSALTMRLSPSTTLWDIKRFCTFAARARGRSAVHASVLPRRPCSTASLKKPVWRPLLEFVFLFEFDLFSSTAKAPTQIVVRSDTLFVIRLRVDKSVDSCASGLLFDGLLR